MNTIVFDIETGPLPEAELVLLLVELPLVAVFNHAFTLPQILA